jgi:hypothetical protein
MANAANAITAIQPSTARPIALAIWRYCIAITTSLYFPVAIESQSRVAGAFGADARSFLLMGDWGSHCGRRAISSNLLSNTKLLQAPFPPISTEVGNPALIGESVEYI